MSDDEGCAVGRLSRFDASVEYARELSGLFTTASLRALAAPGPWEAAQRLAVLGAALDADETLADLLDGAFDVLRRTRRSEYVFKNDIISRLVFGWHKPTSASAAVELGVGKSKADVVVVNGTSTVYEVKSDYDSFARLDTQLRDYAEFAEHVYVVVSPARTDAALKAVPSHVGVIALRRNGRMQRLRDAEGGLGRIKPDRLFQVLRANERANVLDAESIAYDNSTSGMRAAFSQVPVPALHAHVVQILKRRFSAATDIVTNPNFPPSLRALAYGAPLSGAAQVRLLERLRERPSDVLQMA